MNFITGFGILNSMSDIIKRKDEHLEINLNRDVRSGLTTGFEKYSFIHQALPELDLDNISTDTVFLGKRLRIPLLISSMTGGTQTGELINQRLAEAANTTGIAMGVGSQRADIENWHPGKRSKIREFAPKIPLFANLGAVQLNYGFTVEECQKAVEMIEADALILHLNPLQEALQPEGETNFSSLSVKIEQVCRQIDVPVIVKEVGWGISIQTARQLVGLGVAAIDVAGAGGTSWSEVEKHRTRDESRYRVAGTFKEWGIPTAECVATIREEFSEVPLIASGGMSNGMEIAKSIALGANLAGLARPFVVSANQSTEAVVATIEEIETELKITMFAAGAKDIISLSKTNLTHRE